MKFKSTNLLISILMGIFVLTYCKSTDHCPNPYEKIYLNYKDKNFPYQDSIQLKFRHNYSDTQIFIAHDKATFYNTQWASQEGECAKDHECVKISFTNLTQNDVFTFSYEYNMAAFPRYISDNDYTYYFFKYKGKTFFQTYLDSKDSIININGVGYKYVQFIGADTNNYINYNYLGILKIKINGENWDIIQ